MWLRLVEEYDVLGIIVYAIYVQEYIEETGEYFNCSLYDIKGELLAQYRYFTFEDIPKNIVVQDVSWTQ